MTAWRDATINQVGIAVNAGTPTLTFNYSSGVADTNEDFRIGATGGMGGTHHWDGLIDEVGFWKRVLTEREREYLYNVGTGLTYPFEVQLQSYFIVPGGSKSEATMDTNVTALQAYADDFEGRLSVARQRLQLLADFYYFSDTVIWPTRTGLPNVAGSGGEGIYHAEELYTNPANQPGGLVTALVWGADDFTKPMWRLSGLGGVIDGVGFIGKMTEHQADLLIDTVDDPYPYEDPWGAHDQDDRCRTALQIDSTSGFGSGKHIFPHGLSCQLFQRAVWVTDSSFTGHGDQWHVMGRTAFYYCDIGLQVDQHQCFFVTFEHIDTAFCTYPLVINQGGKLLVGIEDIAIGCKAGLYLRGSDSQGDQLYFGTGGDFNASSGEFTGSPSSDFSRVKVGDYAYGGQATDLTWCRAVTAVDDVNNTVTVSTLAPSGPYYGTLTTLTGDCTLRILAAGGTSSTLFVRDWVNFDELAANDALSLLVDPQGKHLGRRSAARTLDRAGHVTSARADVHKGSPILTNTGGVFDADGGASGNGRFSCSGTPDISGIQVGDWVYGRLDGEKLWRWIALVTARDNTAKTIDVSSTVRIYNDANATIRAGGLLYGTFTDALGGNFTVQVYSKSAEKPIYRVINSYGDHTIENHDNLFDGMIHVEGGFTSGNSTAFPTFKIRNCKFRVGTHLPAHPTAIFTRGSTGKVQLIFEGNHEEHGFEGGLVGSVLSAAALHAGKNYDDARFVGSLSDGILTPV